MKTKLFLFVIFMSLISVNTFSNGNSTSAAPGWAAQTGLLYQKVIYAQVFKEGVLYQPTLPLHLAVFKDGGTCRGFKSTLTGSTNKFFSMNIGSNVTSEDGFSFKVYDPNVDAIYDIVQTINFRNVNIGSLPAPMHLDIKYTTVSADQNVSAITDAANADVIVATAGKVTVDANTTLRSVSLNAGGKLDLPSGRTLAVTGNFMLKSGSRFVDLNTNGGLTVSGTTTIQQDLTGTGGATPNGRFWYVGTPVNGATSAVFDAAGANRLWYYNEPTHDYVEITDNTTALQAGRGYLVRLGANTTVNFTGSLISGNQTFNLTNTPGNAYSGYNLIYNPYPSFIRWHDAGSLPSGVSTSIWTRSATVGGVMAFDSYNVQLGAGVSGSGTAVTRYIAPYQAFWVKTTADVTLSIANSMRTLVDVDNTSNALRTKAVNSTQFLRLKVSNGTEGDEALIAFTPNATNSVDGYDTPKMSNDTFVIPEIYTTIGTDKYAINTFNTVNDFALGFNTKSASNFTIKAIEVSNFDTDTRVVLVDKLNNNAEIELVDGAEYAFSSDVAATNDRFVVQFKSKGATTGVENTNSNSIFTLVRTSDNLYDLNINSGNNANVKIFNSVGQLVQSYNNVGRVSSIGSNFTTGIYTVVVKVDGLHSISKKLSIR